MRWAWRSHTKDPEGNIQGDLVITLKYINVLICNIKTRGICICDKQRICSSIYKWKIQSLKKKKEVYFCTFPVCWKWTNPRRRKWKTEARGRREITVLDHFSSCKQEKQLSCTLGWRCPESAEANLPHQHYVWESSCTAQPLRRYPEIIQRLGKIL